MMAVTHLQAMISKKITDLATNVAPSVDDLMVIGDPITGQLKKVTLTQISGAFGSTGTVNSVGLTMPSAFYITGSPITNAGTLAVSMTGTTLEYLRGNGTLATLSTSVVPEGTNLYYNSTRFNTDFDTRFSTKSTSQLINGAGFITGITSTMVTNALGYTPYNSSNPSGYITGINSTMVTNALGYTPYNASNPNGYITSSSLTWGNISGRPTALSQFTNDLGNYGGWATSSYVSGNFLPLTGGTLSGMLYGTGISVSGMIQYTNPIVVQTGSFTIDASYRSKIVEMQNTAIANITIPNDSTSNVPVGSEITILDYYGSAIYFVAESGVTLRSFAGQTRSAGQYGAVALIKRGNNDWYLVGNLTTA